MKDSLIQFLEQEHLSPSKFADLIGVQRSSISHIISGRNKPSFDFLQKTMKAFPLLNADWFILGEGEMYEPVTEDQEVDPSLTSIFEKASENVKGNQLSDSNIESLAKENLSNSQLSEDKIGVETRRTTKIGKVRRMILIYDDNSFEYFESEN